MSPLASIEPHQEGALLAFASGRPWDSYRRFRDRFPKARPEQNWRWLVPGRDAARRLALWLEEEGNRARTETRRRRDAEMDQAWDEVRP